MGQNEGFGFSGEYFGEGYGEACGDVEEGAFFAFDGEAAHEGLDEGGFGFGGEVVEGIVFAEPGDDGAVDDGPEGFHEVVGEGEGVVAVVVVDAEGGVESGGADGAGDDGAEDRVAVVEVFVLVGEVGVAAEMGVGEERGPVAPRGLALDVGGVAGFDAGGHGGDAVVAAVEVGEEAALGADFGLDNLFPGLFAGGGGGLDLLCEALGLEVVALDGEHHARGQVFVVADDDGCARFGQTGEDRLGDYHGAVREDQHAHFLEGDGRDGFAIALDSQPPVGDGQARAVFRDVDDPLEHQSLAF